MTKPSLDRLPWSALVLGLAACSTRSGGATVCPCPVNALTVRYTGSFVQNGTFTVTSVMSGSCTIAITSSNGTATAGVSVP